MLYYVLSILIFVFSLLNMFHQTKEQYITECLNTNNENWNEVLGTDIWIGYENGKFDMPVIGEESFLYGVVQFDNGNEIWIYYSKVTPELFYVFPFNDLSFGSDGGVHPCGAFSIDHDSNVFLVLSTMDEPMVIYDRYTNFRQQIEEYLEEQ